MRRFGLILVAAGVAAVLLAANGTTAPPTTNSLDNPVKLNVLGVWAHPDDDTSIIGPCGVWHQQFGIRCGIIMVTRGEGGGNAVGTEIGPPLGLRRENEDRSAHYRSGTVDIFNLDRVDFFFNQSAPRDGVLLGHDETLGAITRIIRMTQPDVYIGFTPTLGAGHGNHQWAGRMIWEGMQRRGGPDDVPGAAHRAARARHVAGQEDLLRRQHGRHGGHDDVGRLHDRLHPDARHEPRHGRGRLDRLRLAVPLAGRELQGRPAGTPKIWAQVASEGARRTRRRAAHVPGQRRPGLLALRPDVGRVPFQPNTNPDGTANPLAGKDNAILYGAAVQDPGGLPLGTLEYLTFDRFYNVAGQSFTGDAAPEGAAAARSPRARRR